MLDNENLTVHGGVPAFVDTRHFSTILGLLWGDYFAAFANDDNNCAAADLSRILIFFWEDTMKVELYNYIRAAQKMNRRQMLKGSAAVGAVAMMPKSGHAASHGNVRAEILKIPGVGAGSPTDSDWQKVGEMCLGATKGNVAKGEFAGVELTFMGLNNQNLHNFLFRGFLKPWEAYTGAKINWIDLAQADYNARLQQSIATGTVDFDIIEMGAPFEGDVLGKGLASRDARLGQRANRHGRLCGLPQGACWHLGRQDLPDLHRRRLPHVRLSQGLFRRDGIGGAEVPKTWQEINQVSKDLVGKEDPLTGLPAHGYLDPLKGWGGFGFYFLENRASAYAKHPNSPAWLFDPETMKPMVNNPAWVQAIQDVMDLIEAGAYPADQINADPGTTAFQQFLAGTGSMLMWWGDVGSARARPTHPSWAMSSALASTRHRTASTTQGRRLGRDHERSPQHGLYRLGCVRDGDGRR